MKRLSLIPILLSLVSLTALSEPVTSMQNETLTYDIIYKWGLINKVAGYATMTLRDNGDTYRAALYGQNAPWANNIYKLRDTLYTTMSKQDFTPVSYTYIAHEKGKYKKDVLTFHRSGNVVTAEAVRLSQPKPGKPITESTVHFEATGVTVDMLSSFFYLRTLDFDRMTSGQSVTVNIFSGSKPEKLKITYLGHKPLEIGDRIRDTYYINFTFTRKGVESSSPISGWISTDGQRIPLKVEGQLPVGRVRAIYTGD